MKKRILLVGHDANRAGAQLFLLHVARDLVKRYDCSLLLLAGGDLMDDYQAVCPVFVWQNTSTPWWQSTPSNSSEKLNGKTFDLVYLNTIAVASVFPWLKAHVSGKYLSHLHELAYSQTVYSTPADRTFLFEQADAFVGCSEAVSAYIRPQIPAETPVFTVHSFIDNEVINARLQRASQQVDRATLGIPENAFLVGSCGHAEWRKGIDWFLQTASLVASESIHFLWIGFPTSGILAEQVAYDVERMGLRDRVTCLPVTPQSVEWLAQLDLFLLTSREDPFPLVMLEAALAGVPVLGFEKSGGCEEFVRDQGGWVVPYGDCPAMAHQIEFLCKHPEERKIAGENARLTVENIYQFDRSMVKLEAVLTQLMNP